MSDTAAIPTFEPSMSACSQAALRMRVDEQLTEMRQLMAKAGAIRLRGYDIPDLADCQAVAEKFAPHQLSLVGGDSPRSVRQGRIFTANESDSARAVYLHGERSYSNCRPSVVLFFCRQAPAVGGQCLFADGRALWSDLSDDARRALSTQRIRYTRNLPDKPTPSRRSWQQTFGCLSRAEMENYGAMIDASITWLPDGSLVLEEDVYAFRDHPILGDRALMCPAPYWHVRRLTEEIRREIITVRGPKGFHTSCRFEGGQPLQDNLLDEILRVSTLHTRRFTWNSGDIVVIDNDIALHGRDPFSGFRELLVALGSY